MYYEDTRGLELAEHFKVTALRDATIKARARGHKGVGTVVVGPGALFNVVKTTFYRKCSSSEKLGGPFTQAEAVEFLEAL